MRLRLLVVPFVLAFLLLPHGAAAAVRLAVDEDTFVDLRFLLQGRGEVVEEGAPDGESLGKDLYMRRVRLTLGGRVNERVGFTFNFDSFDLGREDVPINLYVQDAFTTIRLVPGLELDAGLMLIPFVHNALQAAGTLLDVDFQIPTFRIPAYGNTVRREIGVQLRGLVLAERLHYRVGVFRGVRGVAVPEGAVPTGLEGINPTDAPLLAGTLRFNFLEPEEGFLFGGIHFGEARIFSVGLAGFWQQDAFRDPAGALADRAGSGVDFYLDLPFAGGTQELVAQGALMRWEAGADALNTGNSWFLEAGWRYRAVGPVVSYNRFVSDAPGGAGDYEALRFGGAWWIDRHTTNLKLEAARIAAPRAGLDPERWQGTLQLQVFL